MRGARPAVAAPSRGVKRPRPPDQAGRPEAHAVLPPSTEQSRDEGADKRHRGCGDGEVGSRGLCVTRARRSLCGDAGEFGVDRADGGLGLRRAVSVGFTYRRVVEQATHRGQLDRPRPVLRAGETSWRRGRLRHASMMGATCWPTHAASLGNDCCAEYRVCKFARTHSIVSAASSGAHARPRAATSVSARPSCPGGRDEGRDLAVDRRPTRLVPARTRFQRREDFEAARLTTRPCSSELVHGSNGFNV